MKVTHTVEELQSLLKEERYQNKSIGFVPTMGALHVGHISLINQSAKENDIPVVSIFVNPTQFNDKNDLVKYPRNLESDCALLEEIDNVVVFAPSEKEIYPEPDDRKFDFGSLANVMEGQFRPGHFNGVAQVVSRLFDIVKPDRAYFGEKDFQQLAIIRAMTKQLKLDIEIIACPIVREEDGLAMSSRNVRLSEENRINAVSISKTLFQSKEYQKQYSVEKLKEWIKDQINTVDDLCVEYIEIVDGHTLQPIQKWEDTDYSICCVAVFAGEVRLIDNISY